MPDDGEDVGVLDGEVATPVLISQVGAEKRSEVGPELVEGGQAGGGTLSKTECTRSGLDEETGTGL